MASLNTLRTKFGVVLSVVIALALLAFILSLKTEMGFSGNDPKVGEINGEKVKYSQYMEAYDLIKAQSNGAENDPQQADMLADAAWQSLFSVRVLEPGFEKMGITVSEAERQGMISGEYPSQVLAAAFADPRTGVYDVKMVAQFLAEAESNPQARQAWAQLNEQMIRDREVNKYVALIRSGANVNSLEVAQGVKAVNNTFSGVWSARKYDSVADSLIQVSSSDIRSYYKSHKNKFKQDPTRTLSYVVFDVNATDGDMLTLENTVKSVGAEFAAAPDPKAFARTNRNSELSDRFVTAAQLPADEAAALMTGAQYGPVLNNNVWTMSRVISEKVTPDTLGIRHIILPYTQEAMADSLLATLRAGADFAQAAQQYSVYTTAANGGDVGKMPFSAFTNEYVDALSGAKQGDIVKVASGDAIQLIQVYYTGKPVRQMQVARINYPVEASTETRRTLHNAANTFLVNVKGTIEGFNEAASQAALTPRVGSLVQGERDLRGMEDSRELVRWAYGAEKGDVSEVFNIGGDYVIAILTDIDDSKFMSEKRAEEQIRHEILRDKKYDYIVKNASGSNFGSLAASLGTKEDGPFQGVTASMIYIPQIGMEPRLVGAITSAEKTGVVSAPVKGSQGVYIFEVQNIVNEPTQTLDAEKVRAQSRAEGMAEQLSLQAVRQMAEVEDLRGKYF